MSYRTLKHRALKAEEKESDTSDTVRSELSDNHPSFDSSASTSMMNISSNISTDNTKSSDNMDNSYRDINTSSQPLNLETSLAVIEENVRMDVSIAQGSVGDTNVSMSEDSNTSITNIHLSEISSESEYADSDDLESSGLTDTEEQVELASSSEDERSLRDKLRDCAIKHSNHITNSFLNDLLGILRSEGHSDLPKTAETLLRTQRTNNRIKPMLSKKGTYGSYLYLGLEYQLRLKIERAGYEEKEIRVLVNVDGLPIFIRSKQQMWPILVQILHKDYYCKPFVVALYCGDSKPHDANDFFQDFVEEVSTLLEESINIDNTLFSFRIAAFVCDTPARAFIKCCKGHTAFYGCERCTVRGVTINKRRVFREMNCTLRTKTSFVEKRQSGHHITGITSPLLRIPGFDPVSGVVLDYMHLLCCGVMKSLLEKWLSTKKQKGNIGRRERSHLTDLLLAISPQIPMEFQRKLLDITDITNWKATQYRLFLLYAGGLILRHVLSPEVYHHFLLLFVATRILCSSKWALMYTDEAESFLRDFFKKMSTFYGKDSQVMNFHNLIHLADDVRNLQAPLTEYSSFPFENCLGNIKRLIRTPRSPIAQIFRRLSETECVSSKIIKHNFRTHDNCVSQNEETIKANAVEYTKISIKTVTIGVEAPDNVVILANGDIFQVSRIFRFGNSKCIFIEGRAVEKKGNAFTIPMDSSKIGIWKLGVPFWRKKTYCYKVVIDKCFVITVKERTYAVSLLHLQ